MPDEKPVLTRQHASSMLLLGLGAVAVGYFGWKASRPLPSVTQLPLELKKPLTEPPPKAHIMVVIQGEVRKPGTYTLESGKRLDALIQIAGGLTDKADREKIASAQLLKDGKLYVIPAVKPKKVTKSPQPKVAKKPDKRTTISSEVDSSDARLWSININAANADLILCLPKITDEQVRLIEDYRIQLGGFRGPNDLKNVPKVSHYDIRRWTPYLRFSGPELIGDIR